MLILENHQQSFHFIGIGGIGMSALALIMAKKKFRISGSDNGKESALQKLIEQGIKIYKEQKSENIYELCETGKIKPVIIISSAIPLDNEEFLAAKKNKLEICHRSDLLAALINSQDSIVISGTHGKTTTSTFITTLLEKANLSPTAIIGGIIPIYKSNANAGQGKLLIAEADESDGSLIKFNAKLGLITNIELDHIDHYKNINELIKTMKFFASNCKQTLANYDCKITRKYIKPTAWWSTNKITGIDYSAIPRNTYDQDLTADIYEKGLKKGKIILPIPGMHNLSNAIASIAALRMQGISYEELQENIASLETPSRRFELKGTWKNRQIIDDYAHHPTEIKATLIMAQKIKESKNNIYKKPRRVLAIFQPHRFSRTKEFLNDFADSLLLSDCIFIAPIYGAGEKAIPGINNILLAKVIRSKSNHKKVYTAKNLDELIKQIKIYSLENDLIIMLGAGNINSIWNKLNDEKNNKLINV